MKTKFNDFVNESIDSEYFKIRDKLKELNEEYQRILLETYDIQKDELNPILSKIIDSNNIDLINSVIEYTPKGLSISSYQFLYQKIYKLQQNPVSKSDIKNYNIPFDKLDKVFLKIKEQNKLLEKIEDESEILIDKIIKTNDLNIMRLFIDVVQNLPNYKFFKKINQLRGKDDDED